MLRDKSATLYHAAGMLRSNFNEAVGIPFQPLNPRDISEKRSEVIVSDDIYNFFIGLFALNFHKVQFL